MCRLFYLFLAICPLYGQMPPQEALQKLVEGNKRFHTDLSDHPDRTSERRLETAAKQEPFAVIVGCSDSRVAPEVIFDQGIGDVFIVRVAGNVIGPIELASIEFSALYLHSALILVLGHENCGAVKAVLQNQTADIEPIAQLIQPAAKKTQKIAGDRLEATIKMNAQLMADKLKNAPHLKPLIDKGLLDVKAGYYNFHTGQVEVL